MEGGRYLPSQRRSGGPVLRAILWLGGWRETMFNAYIDAELTELISSRGLAHAFLLRADVSVKEDMVDALIVS